MRNTFCKPVSFLLGLVALTVVSSATAAQAETLNPDSSVEHSQPTAAPAPATESTTTPSITVDPLAVKPTADTERSASATASVANTLPATPARSDAWVAIDTTTDTKIPTNAFGQVNEQPTNPTGIRGNRAELQIPQTTAMDSQQQPSPDVSANVSPAEAIPGTTDNVKTVKPIPGSLSTSADTLTAQPETSPAPQASSNEADKTVAQNDITNIEPGRATSGGRSYIGIGGNIGISGDTGIGQGGFLINSKIGLTRNISARPSIVVGDDVDFLIPLTYDFTFQSTDPFQRVPFAPFIGGGVAFSTSGGNSVGGLITGGADIPINSQFVANATLNVGFFGDTTDFGLALGVGYTFPGF
ncbi:MAG TPA: hypothetical protein V6C85_28315 [Allocoleopsis sp.]